MCFIYCATYRDIFSVPFIYGDLFSVQLLPNTITLAYFRVVVPFSLLEMVVLEDFVANPELEVLTGLSKSQWLIMDSPVNLLQLKKLQVKLAQAETEKLSITQSCS